MTSATLFREGTDLEALLAELDEQYDGQIRVVEINHTREGGVLGFFARPRVAVHFTVGEDAGAAAGHNPPPLLPGTAEADVLSEQTDESVDPLDALIAAAEMVETGAATVRTRVADGAAIASAPVAAAAQIDGVGNVEFARMLLDIAARKAAERGVDLPAAAFPAEAFPADAVPVDAVPAEAVSVEAPELPAKVISAVKAAAVSQAAEQAARADVSAPATPVRPAVERIEFETLTPSVEVTKPKAVRVAKPKTATKAKSARANAKTARPAAETITATTSDNATKTTAEVAAERTAEGTEQAPVAAKSAAKTTPKAAPKAPAKAPAKAAAKAKTTKASAATKIETAAAVEAKIAAVGQSLRAELSIADLHESDERLTLRRRLSELGVPFDRIPTDAPHRYAAVEQLVHALPGAAPLPETDGQLVVVAGPSTQVAATAELLIKRMSMMPWQVWAYRCPGIAALPDREIRDAGHAATVAAHARQGSGEQRAAQSTLVVIGLDEFEADQLTGGTSAASIVRALGPDAFWLHVDATRKASDTAALVRELGTPTALVVTGASRTASPASVWDLNVPVALLDGRPATPSAWAVLLLDKLVDAAA